MRGVTVLGSLNADLVTTVPRLPRRGETVPGGGSTRWPGGKGANQAVATARAGARIRMAGACGRDDDGRLLVDALEGEGVDTSAVTWRDDVPTGTAVVLVEDSGENMIAITAGANGRVDESTVASACSGLGEGDVLLMQLEVPLEIVAKAARLAATRGATVVLNAAPVPPDAVVPLDDVDVLVLNEHEARAVAGVDHAVADGAATAGDLARALAVRHGCLVVVTLGAAGAVASRGEEPWHAPAPSVRALDTVGAGDAFTGYLAAALSRGVAEQAAIETAVLAASVSVTRPGAMDSVPRYVELDHTSLTGGS